MRRLPIIVLILCAPACTSSRDASIVKDRPYDLVDPFIGTGGEGNTFPGATLPFGMIQWSPDTRFGGIGHGFYEYEDKVIRGFSLTHLSGAGCSGSVYADVPILPWMSEVSVNPALSPATYMLPFEHVGSDGQPREVAHPGYYSVRLPSGLSVELAVTSRTGMGRIVFPRNVSKLILVNSGGSANVDEPGRENDRNNVEIIGQDTVVGSVTSGGFCSTPTKYTLYFAVRFARPFEQFGVWTESGIAAGQREAEDRKTGAYVAFSDTYDRAILLKVGISFVSVENALANVETENPDWDFDLVRAKARSRWSEYLGRIQIEGGTPTQRRIFYTGLYHMLLAPNLFDDANGEYIGFDGQIRRLSGSAQYANFSDWDTYRDVIQLHALLAPRETSDMIQSLIRDAEQSEWLPRWPVANDVTGGMGGDSPAILISSAYAFGAKSFDTTNALKFMLKGATTVGVGLHGYVQRPWGDRFRQLGYIPSAEDDISVSRTLEYASADFAIAQFAYSLGDRNSGDFLMRSAQNWKNLMDPTLGLMHPREANGAFIAGFDPERSLPKRLPTNPEDTDQLGFQEGNTWQYTWMVPHNYEGLFEAMGGKDEANRRLDRFFTELVAWGRPYCNMGNEPDFVTPYAYAFAGAPWKSQAIITRILSEIFSDGPGGLPGNDDLGATSGVYVWGALGMYPAIPGIGGVVVGTPMFSRATITLGDGRKLEIHAKGSGTFVTALAVNGKPHDRAWLALDSIGPHTVLEFVMSTVPNELWGTQDLPPSFRNGN